MELEKLPELALEKLVEQCDRSSKLNLMLVSKRFYNLIGRNPRLCKLKFIFVLFLKISDLKNSNRQRLPAELEKWSSSTRNYELRPNLWINCVHQFQFRCWEHCCYLSDILSLRIWNLQIEDHWWLDSNESALLDARECPRFRGDHRIERFLDAKHFQSKNLYWNFKI